MPIEPVHVASTGHARLNRDNPPTTEGMVWIPGGRFVMGGVGPYARRDELPRHPRDVEGFWIDRTEVTNAQFAEFVEATGYVTVAERAVDWDELKAQLPPGTPKPNDEDLQPGALVFTPPDGPADLRMFGLWWKWVPGASWRSPLGPGSSIEGLEDHPVVQIAYEDAQAFASWAGKRLPTEAEWEYAARGGLDGAAYVWGDEPWDPSRANIFDGSFPHANLAKDGYVRTAPVGSFPPNGFGLYDMAGNVWEWTTDPFDPSGYASSLDKPRPQDEPARATYRTLRGGSFLCNDSYCASYRPSARMRGEVDTGLNHLGFRCVWSGPSAKGEPPKGGATEKDRP